MGRIHLIMPMGGSGTRFVKNGFSMPKPLIPLHGKPFFYWAVRSVEKFTDLESIVFVVLKEHVREFSIDEKIREHFPSAVIHEIDYVLNGAILTCLEGVHEIHDGLPILFNDCDHAFLGNLFYSYCAKGVFSDIDAALLTFDSNNPAYSYVVFDEFGKVTGTVEKKVIGHEAICGAYYFKNKDIFCRAASEYLNCCKYNEFFTSGVYNILTEEGKNVHTFPLDRHISFGTPEELEYAKKKESLDFLK